MSKPYRSSKEKDPVVLSYENFLLHQSDISLLIDDQWLNDSVIGFYMEYLNNDVFKNSSKVYFISPEIVQCIKECNVDDIAVFLDPLVKDKSYSYIFFPLNDQEQLQSVGGTHWSLVVYGTKHRRLFHMDSIWDSNEKQARKLALKLKFYFKDIIDIITPLPTRQQQNSYDCGIHLMCNAENVARYVCANSDIRDVDPVDMEDLENKRTDLVGLIYKLAGKEISS
ncbi:Hypothetical protein CINCED_3A008314 [Cinara cedri]|nr:Hypothetical protein CINCED_3A008314 [Cinara cedri]